MSNNSTKGMIQILDQHRIISDINQKYLNEKNLNIQILGRGIAWLDTGTFDALQEASAFIRTIENSRSCIGFICLGYKI